MEEQYKDYTIADLCSIVSAKNYALSSKKDGNEGIALYVGRKYDMGKTLAFFTHNLQESGYYVHCDDKQLLLYIAFILNSYVGMLFLHNEGSDEYGKGSVTMKNLGAVRICMIPDNYIKACNILELIIGRVSSSNADEDVKEAKEATISLLTDMRNFISLEIYMKPVFVEHQVSVLEPWDKFVNEKGVLYNWDTIDGAIKSFYKAILDPENEVMDAIKKARMFVWELFETLKKSVAK